MNYLERLENEVVGWPNVTIHPHQYGGKEFRFARAEIGHVHTGGTVDIPFPRAIRDTLLEEGLAQQHRWAPDSGWVTFHVKHEEDLWHALWLVRLSYLRYALKTDADARKTFKQESEKLHLKPRLKALLERFVPSSAAGPEGNMSSCD